MGQHTNNVRVPIWDRWDYGLSHTYGSAFVRHRRAARFATISPGSKQKGPDNVQPPRPPWYLRLVKYEVFGGVDCRGRDMVDVHHLDRPVAVRAGAGRIVVEIGAAIAVRGKAQGAVTEGIAAGITFGVQKPRHIDRVGSHIEIGDVTRIPRLGVE